MPPDGSWLSNTRITPRAEKGADELPAPERQAVLETLSNPFRPARTEKMRQRRDIDLWRVRVTRDVRITYRPVGGEPLVLHVGRHADSDSFVSNYELKNESSVPLEASSLMKTNK